MKLNPVNTVAIKKSIAAIKLEPVYGSTYCLYSVIENKLERLYKNQEELLKAIKLLADMIDRTRT